MIKPEKNYDTGIRILEVLKILLEKDISKQELIEMGVLETPKPRTSEMLCFTVKLENLISLG